MTLEEAYQLLELEPDDPQDLIKEQFRWLAKFYHPDNKETGDAAEFARVMYAYRLVKSRN